MSRASMLLELYAHADWGREKVFSAVRDLPDDVLDRQFAMGLGSLREALKHIYGAERLWCERLGLVQPGDFPRTNKLATVGDWRDASSGLAEVRNARIAPLSDQALVEVVAYQDSKGNPYAGRRGDILLHVANHGVHHRAQVLNMLRHVGVKLIGQDYLFMKLERPTTVLAPEVAAQIRTAGFVVGGELFEPVALSLAMLEDCFAYGDWAVEHVLASAAPLEAELLDRPFEMGLGTLRKTLLHIRDAEQWWLQNWTGSPPAEFPKLGEQTSLAELRTLYETTAAARNTFLKSLAEDDLARTVSAFVRPELDLKYRIGESMIQLWMHGTHHRAQALNMLRQLGVEPPGLDLILWAREQR